MIWDLSQSHLQKEDESALTARRLFLSRCLILWGEVWWWMHLMPGRLSFCVLWLLCFKVHCSVASFLLRGLSPPSCVTAFVCDVEMLGLLLLTCVHHLLSYSSHTHTCTMPHTHMHNATHRCLPLVKVHMWCLMELYSHA